jgi:ring-1,2-phenylacetyl-CoA epoxidase subunit PaaD
MQTDVTAGLPSGPIAAKQPGDPHYAIWQLLESVADPEIPVVNLREMGILRAVRSVTNGFEVVITPTYSGCPAMGQMHDDVVAALAGAGVAARVLTQLAPAWTTDWLTPQAHQKLRAYGIATPQPGACASPVKVVQFASKNRASTTLSTVVCPQCGSQETSELSHFGSTACKALYRCRRCLETFDYFKPY